jgi:ABC-type multidrug transport system ATPase subunit
MIMNALDAPLPLQVDKVSFKYRAGALVNDAISFATAAGEILCLLGPNGAGKTTLIRQIVTDFVPKSGSILVCGIDIAARPAAALGKMGVIPQQTNLFDGLTVEQHLYYFGRLKSLDSAQLSAQTARVVAALNLSGLLNKRAGRLSGGQRRLALLALAMIADPALLILDEPTTGLDPTAREMVWSAIRQERDRGKSILLTTHYLEEAESLSDRVGFIVGGRLAKLGTVAELCKDIGKSVRVSIPHEPVRYFTSLDEAQNFIGAEKPSEYSVSRTTLSDIYSTLVHA